MRFAAVSLAMWEQSIQVVEQVLDVSDRETELSESPPGGY